MSSPMPQLKRVYSSPAQNPDVKAKNLHAAENLAMATRLKMHKYQEIHTAKLDAMRADAENITRGGSVMDRLAHIQKLHEHGTAIFGQKITRKNAYDNVAEKAAIAGRKDRYMRSVQKSETFKTLLETETLRKAQTEARVKEKLWPLAAAEWKRIGIDSRATSSLLEEAKAAREALPKLNQKLNRTRRQWEAQRAAGGVDTDSEVD